MESSGEILLTGATGFLGGEVLSRLLARGERVHTLVRARSDDDARTRLRAALASRPVADDGGRTPDGRAGAGRPADAAPAGPGRAFAIAGDLRAPGMGLDRRRRAALAERVGRIVHCAASVSFGLDLDTARAINVEGTRRLLDFASACELRGGFDCFTHVSTAYVAGTHSGSFGESDVDVGQGFRNTYERSKFEAELLVRRRGHSLPVQVMRPSIVVGDSRSGWTDSFNVLYLPLRAFSRGAYPAIPARRSAPVDVVPVDYVADAIVALAGRPGTTHNLVAGERASSVGELLELGSGYFGQRLPRLVPPWLYRRAVHPLLLRRGSEIRRLALRRSEQLFPYFAMRVRYDRRHTHAALEPLGIAPPPLPSYFGRLMDFAVEANWGRRAMPPRLRAQPLGHPGIAVAAVADPVV